MAHVVGERSRRVDNNFGANVPAITAKRIRHGRAADAPVVFEKSRDFNVIGELCALFGRSERDGDVHAGIVKLTVIVNDAAAQAVFF